MRELIGSRHEHAPASSLLFLVLAMIGVVGQVIDSGMLGNWMYFVLNACLVVTNGLGLGLVIDRRGCERKGCASSLES